MSRMQPVRKRDLAKNAQDTDRKMSAFVLENNKHLSNAQNLTQPTRYRLKMNRGDGVGVDMVSASTSASKVDWSTEAT